MQDHFSSRRGKQPLRRIAPLLFFVSSFALGQDVEPAISGSDPSPMDARDEAGLSVRFGVLCLSHSQTCTPSIAVLESAPGWWVEEAAIDAVGTAPELRSQTIRQVARRLIPRDQASWDEQTQVLTWDRPLLLRPVQTLTQERPALPYPRMGSISSLALHYSGSIDADANAVVGLQAIASRGYTSAFAGGVHTQDRFIRDLWRIEHDDVTRQVRYVAGEQIIRPSDPLGGAVRVRGLAIQRAYDTDPSLITGSHPGLHGIFDQPGVIDVYSNGRLLSSMPIQPGPYQWGNLPVGSGSQQLELVFQGADGSRSVLSSGLFYASNHSLAKGLTDFAFRAGTPYDTIESKDVAWQGWVRRGMSPILTLGARAEGQGDRRNMGADASLGFGLGTMDMAYARDSTGESAWSANASISRKQWDAQLSRTHLSPDYWFLGQGAQVLAGASRVVDEKSTSIGFSGNAMSLRSTYAERSSVDGASVRTAGLVGTWRTPRNWRWFATVERTLRADTHQYQATLGLTIPLSTPSAGEVDVRMTNSDQGVGGRVGWSRQHPQITGWSASAAVVQTPGADMGVEGSYERATPVGTFFFSGAKYPSQSFGYATWSGSLIRADGNWFASSPEQGPRVLVKGAEPSAAVLVDNRPEGVVGENGRMVSHLSSYSPVSVSIDATSLSLEADTSHLQKTLLMPREGVAKVGFDTTGNGQLEGALMIGKQPAHFGILTLNNGQESLVGETGRFWIQEGKPGTWDATWTDGQATRSCKVVIEGAPSKIVSASCP